jgi:hypothetical protein
MKSLTTGGLRNPNTLRAKYALRTAIVLTVAFIGTFGLYLYLAQSIRTWQLYILADVTAFVSLMNILAIRYSLKKQVEVAAYLMIAGLVLLFPIATSILSGVGLVLGIAGVIGIYMIATLTLVQPQLGRANAVGVILGIGVILLDAFIPFQRLNIRLLTIYIPIVAILGIGIFAYYLLQEFSNYPLRTKLILFSIIVAVFSVGTVAIITNILSRTEITQQVGERQQALAERLAFETGKELESQVENLQATGTQFEEIAVETSAAYSEWRKGSNC